MNKWLLPLTFLCSLVLLSGCGFTLRGEQPLPPGIKQVSVSSNIQHAELERALKKRLELYQIPVVTPTHSVNDETVLIRLMPDNLDRRLLSLFSSGQVAEYELVFTVRYSITFPGREPQEIEFDVIREYQDDPDAVLAKSRELALVLSEMRQQVADRIIRLMVNQWEQAPLTERTQG